jgi:eukaryotic-like serine/threonine-protein kinase
MVQTSHTLKRCLVSGFCVTATRFTGPLALAGDATARARPDDWTQGEFDARHSGYNIFERIIDPSNVGLLQLVWSALLGGLTIYATPVVATGRVYIGGGDGRMHAFNATTGAVVWTSKKQGLFYVDSAAYADGLVFASAIYAPLVAFDAATGKAVWTSSVVTDLRAPPTTHAHTLYVGAFDGALYALDTRSGAVLWSAPGGCCIFDQAPVVDNRRVFQVRTDDILTAYDAADATELWNVSDFSVGAMAAVDGKLLYGHEPNVVARDQATGALLWTAPYFQSADSGSPAVADGLVFAETNLSDLVALNEETVWTAAARSRWDPSVANGVVFASNYSGEWDAYNEGDGNPVLVCD